MRILRDLQNVIASEYYKTRHDVAAKLFLFFPVLLTVAFIVYDLWNLSQEGYDGTNLWICWGMNVVLFMPETRLLRVTHRPEVFIGSIKMVSL